MEAVQHVKRAIRDIHRAIPDATFTIEDAVESDDTIWVRVRGHGTASGPYFGPPSGRHVDFTVIDIARVVDGRIVEHWGVPDRFAMLAQTGILERRAGGPKALAATATWLRRAFSDMRFEVHEIGLIGDRAVARVTLHGINMGPFVVHDTPDGSVSQVFPPTGRPFAARQVHWFRIEDGAIAEHDAVRDDLGMAQQVGWIPPRPGFVVRMILARRRERLAFARGLR